MLNSLFKQNIAEHKSGHIDTDASSNGKPSDVIRSPLPVYPFYSRCSYSQDVGEALYHSVHRRLPRWFWCRARLGHCTARLSRALDRMLPESRASTVVFLRTRWPPSPWTPALFPLPLLLHLPACGLLIYLRADLGVKIDTWWISAGFI